MEYSDAINPTSADKAFAIALEMRAAGAGDLHDIAVRAVATAYCVCVTDGEDAVEQGLSGMHAELIDDVERRLRDHAEAAGDK